MIIIIKWHNSDLTREIDVMDMAKELNTTPFDILSYYNERCDYAKIIKRYNKHHKRAI